MSFKIEELGKTIKRNPVPWAIGLGVAVVGGYIAYRKSFGGATGYVAEAYPELPQSPEDIATGEAKPGDVTDAQLQELLAELEKGRHEDITQLAELNRQFIESLTQTLESYTSQQLSQNLQQPIQTQKPLPSGLIQKAEYIASTPSIYFSEGTKYSPSQVDVMYNWAIEEQTAISRGYAGTSKNPPGLGERGMTVTYYPTGQVEFKSKGSSSGSKPSSYAGTPAGQALAKAASVDTAAKVSAVTGKSGTVEKQLSGMSSSQKISVLKKAGLI